MPGRVTMRRIALGCAVAATVMGIGVTSACQLHLEMGVPVDTSIADVNFSLPTPTFLTESMMVSAVPVTNPAILSWQQNTIGLTGSSPNATINAIVSAIPADVQWVAYNATSAYVNASG